MPQAFLGFALWRAWVSLTCANPRCPCPSVAPPAVPHDVVLAVSAIVIALFQPHRAFGERRWVYGPSLFCLGSPAANVAALALPGNHRAMLRRNSWPAASARPFSFCCGAKSTAASSPTAWRCTTLAIIGGSCFTFVLQGFSDAFTKGILVLPALSAALAHRSYRLYVPAEDRPIAANRRLIPWKFFLILALFELVASYSSAHIRSAYPCWSAPIPPRPP